MKKYLLTGYTNFKNGDFYFIAPVFISENQYFLSVPDKNDITITEFIPFNIQKPWLRLEKCKISVSIGSEALYMFKYKGELFYGPKREIIIHLYRILSREELRYLTMYDIYYFLGNINAVQAVLNKFINVYPESGLRIETFLMPSVKHVTPEDFAQSLNTYAFLLHHRDSAIPYKELFEKQNDKILFFNYSVNSKDLKDNFDFLINKYTLPEYKDLVVHCFIQNNLCNNSVKTNSQYKIRKLFPVSPLDELEEYFQEENLLRNSQSLKKMYSNALEVSCHITKQIDRDMNLNNVKIPRKIEKEICEIVEKIKEYDNWR